jgi:hypothetical protein
MLNHFHCYSTQPFSTIKVCPVILRCYGTQPFLVNSVILHATVLSHFLLNFSDQSFSIEQGHSFAKSLSRADVSAQSFARRRGRTRWLTRVIDGSRLGHRGSRSPSSVGPWLAGLGDGTTGPSLWHPDLRFNMIDKIFIPSRCNSFSGSLPVKNSGVKRVWPGVISGWVTDQEVFLDVHKWEQKCTEKTSVSLWG